MPKVICARNLHRDFRGLAELAQEQGWTLFKTNGNHIKWQPPKGHFVVSATTPSDWRALQNTKSNLRKAGLKMSDETVVKLAPPIPPSPPESPLLSEPPTARKKRSYRPGLSEAIHSVIASTPGQSMHIEQICLRLRRTYPDIQPKDLYNSLSKLKLSGHLKSTDTGCYLALTPKEAPPTVSEDETLSEEDAVLERFFNAYAELEAYLVKMKKRIAKFNKLKQAVNGVDID